VQSPDGHWQTKHARSLPFVLDDKRSVGGAKDQFARNHGGVVVAAVAAACSGS